MLLFISGCGYLGEPLPPLANIPERVTGLSVVQRGSDLVVQFAVPQLTTEGMPIKPPLELDLRVGPVNEPFNEAEWAAHARRVYQGSSGAPPFQVPAAEWAGKDVAVGARETGSNGKSSVWALERLPVVAPLPTPMAVSAANTEPGVRLAWSGSGTSFRVFRRSGEAPYMVVAEPPAPPWVDNTSQFGQPYSYKVQAVRKLSDNHEAESEISAEVTITPRDEFAPATPSGLRAAPSPNSIEVSWNGNTESDLAFYRVYRSVNGGQFESLSEVTIPTYSDRDVAAGKSYRYAVTAVDRSGNESSRSNPAEVRLE